MKYYLGIDNGGTVTKACVFDEKGRLKDTGKSSVKLITPFPGSAERDPEEIYKANIEAVNKAVKSSGINPSQISAIGLSGHGKGLYTLNKKGKTFMNSLLSSDSRAAEITEEWKRNGTEKEIFDISFNRIVPGQPLPLLKWFKIHKPDLYNETAYVLSVNDFIRYRLTGVLSSGLNDLSGSAMLNLKTLKPDEKIFNAAGISEAEKKLAPVISSFDTGGETSEETLRATGIPKGTPVAGGLFDINACGLALGMTDENIMTVIAGTWAINEALSETPVTNSPTTLNSLYCSGDYYLIEESSPTSSGNLEWIRQNLFPLSYEEINAEAENAESGLLFLPFLMGTNVSPHAKSCFVGMTSFHNRGHMLKAVYEGVAFSHRMHIERLKKCISGERKVRMAGGAVNSAIWMQIFADVLGTEIETTACEETGCLGAAFCAMLADGTIKNIKDLGQFVNISKTYYPDEKNKAKYDELYGKYIKLNSALADFWEDGKCWKN